MIAVVGGQGFIGSHLVDALVEQKKEVMVYDNASSGDNVNDTEWGAAYEGADIREPLDFTGVEVVFHTAAVARTPAAIADPVLCWETNLMGSVHVLEAARQAKVKRVVLSSSNIVYAAPTPYRASKLAMEEAAKVYHELYGLSVVCLRYANTYGTRQRQDGIGPNVFASLRKSLEEKGHVEITGDGRQSRDFIHVSDVVRANLLAADSWKCGTFDICTGDNWTMNEIAGLIRAEIEYLPEREGDVKHIKQNTDAAKRHLGFSAKVALPDGIRDCFPVTA